MLEERQPGTHPRLELHAGEEGAAQLAVQRVCLLWRWRQAVLQHHRTKLADAAGHAAVRAEVIQALKEREVNTSDGFGM